MARPVECMTGTMVIALGLSNVFAEALIKKFRAAEMQPFKFLDILASSS
jgi:hypothetical protein